MHPVWIFIQDFLAPHGITRDPPEIAPHRLFLRAPARLPALFPGLAADPRHRAPETKKGGRISPAARAGTSFHADLRLLLRP